MPSDPLYGGQSRLYLFPETGDPINLNVESFGDVSPEHDMKPVTITKDYVAADKTTYKAEDATTTQLVFSVECFSDRQLTPAERKHFFSGKKVGPVYIKLDEGDEDGDDAYWLPYANMTVKLKPGAAEDHQKLTISGKSWGPYLTGEDAVTAYEAAT